MISIRGLTKRYGGRAAVDDLTFDVGRGTVTGFLGPNGSGKSTTMRLLLGLATPDAGAALIDGVPYRSLRWPNGPGGKPAPRAPPRPSAAGTAAPGKASRR